MKKLLLFLALAAVGLQGWADDFYIVGNATGDGWTRSARTDAYKMTKDASLNKYTWTGILYKQADAPKRQDIKADFKICVSASAWAAWCASTADKNLEIGGTTDTPIKYNDNNDGGNDRKWVVQETGYYEIILDLSGVTKSFKAELLVKANASGTCLIGNETDLTEFRKLVNKGKTSLNAELTANITLTGNHTPIGTSTNKYAGTFDGQGHNIENLSLSASSGSGVGFFGYTNGATIQDVEFLKANVNVTGGNNTGIVVGICDGGAISQCAVVNSYITGCDHTGSIAGSAKGGVTISNCYSNAKVSSISQAGGLIGTVNGNMTLEKCIFMGPRIDVSSNVGTATGLISLIESGSTTMRQNFVATSHIRSEGDRITYCRPLTRESGGSLSTKEYNYSLKKTLYNNDTYGLDHHDDINGAQKEPSEINETFFSSTLGFDFTNTWKMVTGVTYAGGGSFPILKWMTAPATSAEISSATELYEFSLFMWDNQNVTLMNDIDYSAAAYQGQDAMIGTEVNPYKGTFDGQCHTITVGFNNTTANETGLFRYISGGTIKNLKVAGTITTNKQFAGGICSRLKGTGTIKNCESSVTITDTRASEGDGTHGGILACVKDVTDILVENCLFSGSFDASNSHGCGGVVGWTADNSNVKVKNCLVTGSLGFENHSNNSVIARENDTHAVLTNCKFTSDLTGLSNVKTNGLTRTTSGANTGALCYLLNSETSGGTDWYQNLSPSELDSNPSPFSTHKKVYQNQSTPTAKYSNYDITLINDVYQISNAQDLNNFAALVNAGNDSMNAELTEDIDYSASAYQGQSAMIGNGTYKYAGTFDGKNHVVNVAFSNVKNGDPVAPEGSSQAEDDPRNETALFRRISNGGVVKNLKVTGTITTDMQFAAGICSGIWGSGTITNCEAAVNIIDTEDQDYDCTHGGILARVKSKSKVTVTNCLFSGTINAPKRYGCGGIVGWPDNASSDVNSTEVVIKNNLVTGTLTLADNNTNDVIVRNTANTANNYYTCSLINNLRNSKSATDASSYKGTGELCYLLNGDQSDIVWYQNIDEENSYPVPFNTKKVVRQANSGSFTNLAVSDNKAQIGSAADLTQFSLEVNRGGNVNTNAVLTADIDMTSIGNDWWPIGYGSNKYAGTFDGDKHEITFSVDYGESSSYAHQAMFGMVTNGASISNLIVKGEFRANSQVAGVVAYADGDGTVTLNNIMNYADIQATENGGGANASGFVACAAGNIVINATNCANLGTISSGNSQSGAFAGWINKSATFTNCWNIGEIYNIESGTNQLYRHSAVVTPVNCYDLTEIGSQGDKSLDADAAVTGELCYKLNGNSCYNPSWTQTKGTDDYPIPFNTQGIVNKISSVGYTTQYIPSTDVTIPANVEAYAGVINGNWLSLRKIEGAIFKNDAVILKGSEGYYSFVPTTGASEAASNALLGSDGDVTGDGTSYYALSTLGGTEPIGFYLVNSGVTIPAGKAYLNTGAGVKGFTFLFDDDATSIEMVNGQSSMVNDNEIYNLAGQRLNKAQKGINIVNGKKIMK